jgi:hypothetical protein
MKDIIIKPKSLKVIKMSSKNYANNNKQVNKPFCKVCHDAGKPESVYTSHFVRSAPGPNGKVTCPTLLSLQCRYCYQSGHTVKFCSVLKEKNNYQARAQEKESVVQPRPTQRQKEIKPTNAFAALDVSDEESDEETQVTTVIKDEFPALDGAKLRVQEATKPAFSYANALATEKPKPVARPVPQIVLKSRWVDAVSSDEEDEDENEECEDNSAW